VADNAARDVARQLQKVRTRAAGVAVQAAATAGGRAGETAAKEALRIRTHKIGTRTPSQPGQPPAKVSGALARSVQRAPTKRTGPGRAESVWGSKLIYAPVQEYGAQISARNFPQLGNPEVGFFGQHVRIPARPWMEFSVRKATYSGTFGRASAGAFARSLGL
jgi:phage gpG-like protein